MTLRVETEIKVGEASRAGFAAARRWGTGGWSVILAAIILALVWCWVGNVLAGRVGRALSVPESAQWLLNLAVGLGGILLLWMLLARRLLILRYRRRIAERGHVGPYRASYEITGEAFVYVIGGISRIVHWAAISEVFRAHGWWVLMAQGESLFVPARAFAGPQTERAFIAAVLEHLSEDARSRSKDAVAFAAAR